MKYSVINGPKGITTQATRGRKEGQETPAGIIVWNYFDSREEAEASASRLRETQRRVEGAASGDK